MSATAASILQSALLLSEDEQDRLVQGILTAQERAADAEVLKLVAEREQREALSGSKGVAFDEAQRRARELIASVR
jgi:hypothetical protein